MSYRNTIAREGDDAIITTTFDGYITPEDFAGWNSEIDQTQREVFSTPDGRVYVIMDVRGSVTTDFGTIIREMNSVPDDMADVMPFMDRFTMMFVGDAPMAKLTVELARRSSFFGGRNVPMFRTMEDAHAFIAIDRQQAHARAGD
jgi:hypothetical protein